MIAEIMVKILSLLLLFCMTSCTGFVVNTTSMMEKFTKTQRNILQIKEDEELRKKLEDTLTDALDSFVEEKNIRYIGSWELAVIEGRVMVVGVVSEIDLKLFIYDKIWENPKVKEVINELQVSLGLQVKPSADRIIRNSINSKLKFLGNTKSFNYNIYVYNSVAYVIGIAEDQTELERVGFAISTVKGVKNVVSHVILKDDKRREEFIR